MTNRDRLVEIIDKWFWTKKIEPTNVLADRILESLEVCKCVHTSNKFIPESEPGCLICNETGITVKDHQ